MGTPSPADTVSPRRRLRRYVLGALAVALVLVAGYSFGYEPPYRGTLVERPPRPLIFAHRGFGDHGPDNSLYAVERAHSEDSDADRQVATDRLYRYYLRMGRIVTVVGIVVAVGTAGIASQYTNIMNYIQLLFGFFNAPLFATFILAMYWKRATPWSGIWGLASGTIGAAVIHVLYAGAGWMGVSPHLSFGHWEPEDDNWALASAVAAVLD